MPNSALLFVPLLAGFLFLRIANRWRYVSRGWESTRLIFNTACAGLAFVGAARIIATITRHGHLAQQIRGCIVDMFPGAPFAPTLVCTILLAVASAGVYDFFVPSDEAAWKSREAGDRLHVFLAEEFRSGKMLQLTMDDGKVYIGYVQTPPTLDPKEKYTVLIPAASGFRSVKRKLKINTRYMGVLRAIRDGKLTGMTRDDLRVILPTSKVVSAHLFDPAVYEKVTKDSEETAAQ